MIFFIVNTLTRYLYLRLWSEWMFLGTQKHTVGCASRSPQKTYCTFQHTSQHLNGNISCARPERKVVCHSLSNLPKSPFIPMIFSTITSSLATSQQHVLESSGAYSLWSGESILQYRVTSGKFTYVGLEILLSIASSAWKRIIHSSYKVSVRLP